MATITSNGTGGGLWTAGTSWVGGVAPTSTDDAVVVAGDTITFNRNDNTGTNTCLSLSVSGTVYFSRSMNTYMQLGSSGLTTCLTFAAATTIFDMGTPGDPIPAAYTCDLKVDTDSNEGNAIDYIYALARWDICGDPLYNAAATTISGEATGKFAAGLAATANVADTTITLDTNMGLRAGGGDFISVWESDGTASTGTQGPSGHQEFFTTTSYNPATKVITLPAGLAYAHVAGGRVVNFTRNVTVRGTSTSRRPRINMNTTLGTLSVPPYQDWRHCNYIEIARMNNANSPYAPLGLIKMVGNSFYVTSGNEMGTVGAATIINCHFHEYGVADGPRYNSNTFSASYCTFSGNNGYLRAMLQGGTVSNCYFSSGFFPANNQANVTYTSCVFEESYFVGGPLGDCAFIGCTFRNIFYMFDNTQNTVVTDAVIQNCAYFSNNNARDIIVRGGTVATTSGESSAIGNFGQSFYRLQRRQETSLGTYTVYLTGTVKRYTISDVPDAIFPLPSGSNYANRLVPANSMQYLPITINFQISAVAGQSFTFTVPIMPRFTSTFTTDDVYLSIAQPGSTALVRSLQTLGAANAWTYFTATGTAVSDGPMVCSVVLGKIGGNYYIDFPLAMASTGYVWVDGIPNENQLPLSGTPAADVWNYPTSSAVGAGTMGLQASTTASGVDDNQALIISM